MEPSASAQSPSTHSFTVDGKKFVFDGKPYQIISGEMHYPRVPRPYWRDRFRSFQAERSRKNRKSPEESLFLRCEMIIAPGDGAAQGQLVGRDILFPAD